MQLFQWVFETRRFFGLVALFCASMLVVGWVLQYAVGLTPCSLCIIQRFFFGGVGVIALLGYFHGKAEKVYLTLMLILAMFGWGVAIRNVYIQLVPQGLGVQCIPWLESFTDLITVLFQATGDCSKRDWTMIGLSIPEWSLLSFSMLGLSIGWMLAKHASSPKRS